MERFLSSFAETGLLNVDGGEAVLSVSAGPSVLEQGDAVTVFGYLVGPGGLGLVNKLISVVVIDADDTNETPIVSDSVYTGSDGGFAQAFALSDVGEYRAFAEFIGPFGVGVRAYTNPFSVRERISDIVGVGYWDIWLQMLCRTTPVCKCPVGGELLFKPALGEPCTSFVCPEHGAQLELPFVPPHPPVGVQERRCLL